METTEINTERISGSEIPTSEIPSSEIGHSLLAMIHAHQESPGPVEDLLLRIDQVAVGLEDKVQERHRFQTAEHDHSLKMAEMYLAISQLLDLIHERITHEQSQESSQDSFAPLATSIASAFEEINQRIQSSEDRQVETLESTLKHWENERDGTEAERLLQIESIQVQAQIEVNRLLRVMWLGTGLAAVGAGLALFLLGN